MIILHQGTICVLRLVLLGQAYATLACLNNHHIGNLDRLGHDMRVILLFELVPLSLSALGPSILYFREYVFLPLQDIGFHKLPRDRLIVKGIVSECGRLHLTRLTDAFQVIEELSPFYTRILNDLSLTILKALYDYFSPC